MNSQNADSPQTKKNWQRKTAAQILATEYQPLKMIVPEILPEGLSILSGAPKTGKSWFSLHLATAVSSGGVFMGSIHVEKRTVLYLALEDVERRLKNRLQKQGCGAGDSLFIETAQSWRGGIATLRAYLKEFPETALVIIDTLFQFCPMEDTSSYSETTKAISAIQKIATETQTAILLLHHTKKGGKNEGGSWADQSMGSNGIIGGVDTILILTRQDGRNEGTLTLKGRDVQEKKISLVFDTDLCTWRIIGEIGFEKPESKARADLIAVLERAGARGMATGAIAETLGKSGSSVVNLLKTLETMNRVKNVGRGLWCLSQFSENSPIHMNSQMNFSEKVKFTNSLPLRESEKVNLDLPENEPEIW
jgi:hypothetical protein